MRRLLPLAPVLALALEDSAVLVQKAVSERQQGISCRSRPEICHDGLFNCESNIDDADLQKQITRATNGHSNPNALCKEPVKLNAYKKCIIDRDPVKAAQMMWEYRFPKSDEDGQYCYAAGHCNNTGVTENTTVQEAEQMCNQVYGNDVWSGIGYEMLQGQRRSQMGRKNRWAQIACAEGKWHCDVIYCRETVCKDDRLRKNSHGLAFWTPGEHWLGVIPAASYRSMEAPVTTKKERKHRSHSK